MKKRRKNDYAVLQKFLFAKYVTLCWLVDQVIIVCFIYYAYHKKLTYISYKCDRVFIILITYWIFKGLFDLSK